MARFRDVMNDTARQAHRHRLGSPAGLIASDAIDDPLEVRLNREFAHGEQALGFDVVRLDVAVAQWPGQAAMRGIGGEFVRRETQQCRAVPLGLATEIEVLLGHDAIAAAIKPLLAAQELAVVHHALNVERTAVSRESKPLLQQRNAQTGANHFVRDRRAARARTNHNGVKPRWRHVRFSGTKKWGCAAAPDGGS